VNAPDRDAIRELLPLVALGIASAIERETVRHALAQDAELAREAAELELALISLGASEAQTPPVSLKTKLLAQARLEGPAKTISDGVPDSPRVLDGVPRGAPSAPTSSHRTDFSPTRAPVSPTSRANPRVSARWLTPILAGVLTVAAAIGGIMAVTRGTNTTLDAGVVATTTAGGLIYTNASDRDAPITLVGADWKTHPVRFTTARAPYFTKAVSNDGLSYVLDARNAKLFIVDEAKGELIDTWPVPEGASGLSVDGDMVCVKSATTGTVLTFRRNGIGSKTMVEARVSNPAIMPLEDFMDAAEIHGDRVYVTHHATGLVTILELSTNRELKRAQVGVKPVSLAFSDDDLLVLDYAGSLIKLDPDTLEKKEELKLEGSPDRITIAPVVPGASGAAPGGVAYLSDRSGFVTAVNVNDLKVIARRNLGGETMDLSVMPDGHIAVAGSTGVKILDDKLQTVRSL
jgi:outer membrane protein assembly factor BamB